MLYELKGISNSYSKSGQGSSCGQVVIPFYLIHPSSNPADVYSFNSIKLFEKNENKQKEAGVGSFFKKKSRLTYRSQRKIGPMPWTGWRSTRPFAASRPGRGFRSQVSATRAHRPPESSGRASRLPMINLECS